MLAKLCILGSWVALLRFHDGIAEVGRWLAVEATAIDRTLAQKTPKLAHTELSERRACNF
ncbi:uncharacterized protein PG986_011156 [Apiospora aurea]|uniref:Uncharacterized protein n=1 Tax=Apiospora aurea TaxID=335848 RepID=A0ABR1Q4C4_9PEZI